MQKAKERTLTAPVALRVRQIILLLLQQVPQCSLRKCSTAHRELLSNELTIEIFLCNTPRSPVYRFSYTRYRIEYSARDIHIEHI